MFRGFSIFTTLLTVLALLVGVINWPHFAVADHCEQNRVVLNVAVIEPDVGRFEIPADSKGEAHESECPTQHQQCSPMLSVLHKSEPTVIAAPVFAVLVGESVLTFKKARFSKVRFSLHAFSAVFIFKTSVKF